MENMSAWIVGLICVVVELVITTLVGLFINSRWDKYRKEKEELEQLRENERKQQQNDNCNQLKCVITGEMDQMRKDFRVALDKVAEGSHQEWTSVASDLEKMKGGMQKDIRRSLRQDAAVYLSRGWATTSEKTEFDELYWSYHNLGRNGVMDATHERVMQLPEHPKGE